MAKKQTPQGAQPQVQDLPAAEPTDQGNDPTAPLNPPEEPEPGDFADDEADVNDAPAMAIDVTPQKLKGRPGVQVLLEACAVFGINPDPDAKPRELLDFKHYPDPDDAAEDAVVIVTCGGTKLRYPIDADTEATLQRVLGLVTTEKQPDGTVREVRKPLGDNLTLPKTAVDGLVPGTGPHVYPGGYLRRGGDAVPKARKAGK